MNKSVAIIIALFCAATSFAKAQDLLQRVPADALAIVTIKTDRFFELLPQTEFNQANFVQKIFSEIDGKGIKGVEDLGISLNQSAYFYTLRTDSVMYNTLLIPLADIAKFENLIDKDIDVEADGTKQIVVGGDNVVRWNQDFAVFVVPALVQSFFYEPSNAQRYGILNPSYSDYYNYDEANEEYGVWAEVEYEDFFDEVDSLGDIHPDSLVTIDVPMLAEGLDVADIESDGSDPYYDAYYADIRIKDSLKMEWAVSYVRDVMQAKPQHSIAKNRDFMRRQDKSAIMTFWMDDVSTLFGSWLWSAMGTAPGLEGSIFEDYKSFYGGIYADKDQLRMTTSVELTGTVAKSYRRIYNQKLNRNFLKYVDSERAMGFASYAMSMENYLTEMPNMLRNVYGATLAEFGQEIDIAAEFFSIIIDEKAIGKVMKGDGLFVVNGISEHEVAYTDYEYDADYNVVYTEKTKTEFLPDFLFMMSSDDNALYQRLMNYAVSKYVAEEEDDAVYSIVYHELPIPLYVTKYKGVLFVGTAKESLQQIARGKRVGQISKKHRQLLRNNLGTAFVSVENIINEIPLSRMASIDQSLTIKNIFDGVGDFHIKSRRGKGNTWHADLVAETPSGYQNGAQYLFSFFDNIFNSRLF